MLGSENSADISCTITSQSHTHQNQTWFLLRLVALYFTELYNRVLIRIQITLTDLVK